MVYERHTISTVSSNIGMRYANSLTARYVLTFGNISGSVPLMKLTVNVTEECIKNGSAKDASSCPIALAINELGYEASVDDEDIFINDARMSANVETPPDASRFILYFDEGKHVEPFSFEIYVPENDDE